MRLIMSVIISTLIWACAPTSKLSWSDIAGTTVQPEEPVIFSIPSSSITRELKDTKPDILKGFPFVSAQPVINFNGKFPPEFYSSLKYRWNAEFIKSVDFWRLRYDQHMYDVIYINPVWIGELTIKEDDFLRNIAYSYNISDEQVQVLEKWINEGGILWIESAIFISSYDYNLNKFSDEKLKSLVESLRSMTLFGNKIQVQTFLAKRIDEFNTEKLLFEVTPEKNLTQQKVEGINKHVNKLLIEQTDYVGIYITIEGNPIIKSGDTVYASFANYGKGKIITLAPFDFKDVHYDGEIFRFDLLSWALNDRT